MSAEATLRLRSVSETMDDIRRMFPAGHKVTVVVRDPGRAEGVFILTDDTLERVRDEIDNLCEKETS